METYFVVGAGGIGCAVGYALGMAGARVVFVEADADKIRWGRAHGIQVDHRPPYQAEFTAFEDWHPSPGATVLLCTKCYDNAAVLVRLPNPISLIPIQNGFDRAIDDWGGSLEGIASFVSECYPGRTHVRITRAGQLHLGPRQPAKPVAQAALVTMLRPTPLFHVEPVEDILPYKYTKLMYNAAISPLAAAAGLDNGQLLALPRARRLFFRLLQENYTVLRDAGILLGKIGPFHPDTVARILRFSVLANSLAWAFYPTLRRSYCSMSSDLPRGRTEIEFYNRHLIDLAGDRPCPLNRQAYDLIKRMERERLAPGVMNLETLG